MDKTEEYRGFKIVAHSGQTESGKCFGSYKITPVTKKATEMIDRSALRGWGSQKVETTSDDRAANPQMLNHEHLFENARRDIDHFIERDGK